MGDRIKIYPKEVKMGRRGVDLSGSVQQQMTASCEYGKEDYKMRGMFFG